jgi:hypothetical protein
VVEIYSTHPGLGGVCGPDKGRLLRDHFSKVSGPMAQAGCEGSEGVEMLAQTLVDAYSVSTGSIEGQLECTEKPGISGDGDGNESKLPQVTLPGLLADAPAVLEVLKDGSQGVLTMSG